MNNKQVDPVLAKVFLSKFETKKHMTDWIDTFFGLRFPDSFVDPDSNSSPIDWMYEAYEDYKNNRGNISPEVIVISSRESYKTLSEAVFGVIMMTQFGATLAHMAAIVPQATAAQKYVSAFTQKIEPYLEYHNMSMQSENAKEISIKREDGSVAFMKIIVCTITGANSSHTNLFTIDEIDTIRSKEGIRAYKESQMIPGVFNGQFPITIKTSTMKFPGGLFSKEMEKALRLGYKVRRWNLIDITEKCPASRHKPELPKELVYTAKSLPLQTISAEQFKNLSPKEQEKYEEQEAMGGCAKCPLLPVCKGRLAKRSDKDTGGLWKPIDFTITQFNKTDPDLAEAQLMCWKPSSQGMVYGRFLEKADGTGNTYSLEQAYMRFTGDPMPKHFTQDMLVELMHKKGIPFYVGGDWGHVHAFCLVVVAVLPSGENWIMDTISISGLEFDQMLDEGIAVRDKYRPKKWYMDTAEPMFIKTFKKNRMPCAEFTKDIAGGIEAVRGQVVNARGTRRLKVLLTTRNEWMLKMFREHCFLLDSNGEITKNPDDSEVADTGDSLRYAYQNIYKPKKRKKDDVDTEDQKPKSSIKMEGATIRKDDKVYESWVQQHVRNLAKIEDTEKKGTSGSVIWDFGEDD